MGRPRNNSRQNNQRRPYNRNNNGNQGHGRSYNNRDRSDRSGFHKKDGFNKQNRQFTVRVSLKEDQVGITRYVSEGKGFQGVLKSRFSDFHVNEIDLNDKVLELNNLDIPQSKEELLSTEELEAAKDSIKDVVNDEVWEQIKSLAATKNHSGQGGIKPQDSAILVDVTELDKDKRTHVHKIIKKLYDGKLVSSTVTGDELEGKEDDKKFIRVMQPMGRDRNRWTFPEEYVHFLVHKENLDTSEVASNMANKMNLRPSQVNYCGTKDKRAKTTQKFCIKKRTPSQIVGSIKHIHGVKVGNFEFHKEVLKLGQLKGNRFRIALRHLTGEREHIETSLNNIKEHGFINYYGLQRFGNSVEVPTYEVGVALLKADYKLACELILKPRENDLHFLKSIRELWWKERDSKQAAKMFRSDRFIEKKLLDGLAQFGESDYASALRKIPRNMLLLYPHAFQSLVFNLMVSRRIEEFGLKVIPGDLVYRNKDDVDEDFVVTEGIQEDEAEDGNGKVEEDGETENVENKTTETEIKTDGAENENTESIFKLKVKALTEEEINSGAYNIFDVVLPLPGYDITYPNNEVGTWYEELLAKYELSSEKLKHNVKTYSMAGAYRKLLLKPKNMSWEFRSYATPEETLILSDMELLKGKTLDNLKGKAAGEENKHEALILDFCLSTSAYATMMLRELLKSDTSAANQTNIELAAMEGSKTEEESNVDKEEEGNKKAEKRSAPEEENEKDEDVTAAKISKDNEEHESV